MDLRTTIHSHAWQIKTPSESILSWPPLISMATTMGQAPTFSLQYCPDAESLGHELFHVEHTSWLRYLWSYTVGRIYGSKYWRAEENAANAYGAAHKNDADLIGLALQVRALYPASSPTAVYSHPVT